MFLTGLVGICFLPTVVMSVKDLYPRCASQYILLSKRQYLASEMGNTFLCYVTVSHVRRMVISCLVVDMLETG
jgi:hypothetical protein